VDAIIEVRDLHRTFEPDVKAVDGVSFEVGRGEVFGFLGPNGAGKSTTIKILTTLLAQTSGIVRIDGLDPTKEAQRVRHLIGYTAQQTTVDDLLTGRENLELVCALHHVKKSEIDGKIDDLLREVDLTEAADRKAGTYSGGMRKRLDLASGLIGDPKILFLDEPTTGLDPQNRQSMWQYIKSLNDQGVTIFLTTQYLEEADRLCDRLCIIDFGKVVAQGTPAELKAGIGADSVRIALGDGHAAEARARAREVLQGLPGVQEITDYDGGVLLYAREAPALIASIVRALDEAKISIKELALSHPTLDDVFVRHTGRKMRVEEVKPQHRMAFGPGRRRM
jgi:ABC-2 type transport system ATP-binding protein